MSPLSLPSVLLWIGFYIATKRVMDVQKGLLEWLEEATLFPPSITTAKEQSQKIDDPFGLSFEFPGNAVDAPKPKDNSYGDENFFDLPDVSDILVEGDWMDEKIDLSILDSGQDWLDSATVATNALPENSGLQPEYYVDYFFSSSSPPPNVLTLTNVSESAGENADTFGKENLADISRSPPSSEGNLFLETGLQLPSSPSGSSCSGSSFTSSAVTLSPSNYEPNSVDHFDETELVYSHGIVGSCVEIVISDQELVTQQKEAIPSSSSASFNDKKGGVNRRGKDISNMRKSLSDGVFAPYTLKKESRRERKKVQNKEAAARYRVKKREQDRVLSDEVAVLEEQQAKLKEQHDKLKSEVTYLKSLMRELFQARGILKKSK